ncbi:MAG: OmpH family outer membrane protein [Ignavibacteria bacterium]|nr:OmpH family outer membrane protein [Ignavibacteria bacterium]
MNSIKISCFIFKKRLLLLLPLVLIFFIYPGSLFGQTKVGYIDSKKIVESMQEASDAKLKLDNLVAEWQSELTVLQDSLKNIKEDYDKKKLILTEQLKQQKEQEIADLETFISNFKVGKFGENGEYFQKQKEFMKPVQDRIFLAIQTVAEEEDFDYVFDRSSEILLLYVNERYDLTAKVMKIIEGK